MRSVQASLICILLLAVPAGATEFSCGSFGCELKGPLDTATVQKLKATPDWNAKPLRFWAKATDADLKTVTLLKDELLGLSLEYCSEITSVAPLAQMKKLESLNLARVEKVTDLSPLAKIPTLKRLDLSKVPFQSIAFVSSLVDLEEITFFQSGGGKMADISAFKGLTKLRKVKFYADPVTDISPLAGATGMEELSLYMTRPTDLTPLKGMKGLKVLSLYAVPAKDLSPVGELTELTKLDLYMTVAADYSPIARLTKMQDLTLTFTSFDKLELLSGMTGLKELHLWKCPITSWAPLAKLTSLEKLFLMDTSFSDASLLAGMKQLNHLDLAGCGQLKSVDALKALPRLEMFRLEKTGLDFSDVAKFQAFPALRYLYLTEAQVPAASVAKLKSAAPAIQVSLSKY